jgi:3alpha(or 20beta)-hydroxysteroid dehydrogenase
MVFPGGRESGGRGAVVETMGSLTGGMAVVTRGAGAIGSAVASAIVAAGARVVVTDVLDPEERGQAHLLGDPARGGSRNDVADSRAGRGTLSER